jgi:regulator of protease activity HflC (stomatin/prohibitin superfamily)
VLRQTERSRYLSFVIQVISVTNVKDTLSSTRLLAQTILRNILGTKTLQEILSDREVIAHSMQIHLDEGTEPWGVKVERVEMYEHYFLSFEVLHY